MNIENIIEIEESNNDSSYSKVSIRLDEKYAMMLSTLAKLSKKPVSRYLSGHISKKIIEWLLNDNQDSLKEILAEIDKKYEGLEYGRKGFVMTKENIDKCKYSEILDSPVSDLLMKWEKDTQNSFIKELTEQFEFQYKPEILRYAEKKAEELPSIEDQ